MNYKIEKVRKNFRKSLILFVIIWLVLTILFVAPIAYSIVESTRDGKFISGYFIENIIPALSSFTCIFKVLDAKYIGMFFKTTVYFTLFYIVVVIIGLVKSAPKNEYTDIEHGSSDWSENGEQYRILSKNKGIILAQNNYLPINKRGNVNVLVVGRFRFW
jgi:hypothetical protein